MKTREDGLAALRPIHPTKMSEVQKQALLKFQVAVEDFNHALFDLVPECADRTAAFRKFLEAKMTCVQAITHTGFETKVTKKETENDDEKAD